MIFSEVSMEEAESFNRYIKVLRRLSIGKKLRVIVAVDENDLYAKRYQLMMQEYSGSHHEALDILFTYFTNPSS
jgi:hypothetical protein